MGSKPWPQLLAWFSPDTLEAIIRLLQTVSLRQSLQWTAHQQRTGIRPASFTLQASAGASVHCSGRSSSGGLHHHIHSYNSTVPPSMYSTLENSTLNINDFKLDVCLNINSYISTVCKRLLFFPYSASVPVTTYVSLFLPALSNLSDVLDSKTFYGFSFPTDHAHAQFAKLPSCSFTRPDCTLPFFLYVMIS